MSLVSQLKSLSQVVIVLAVLTACSARPAVNDPRSLAQEQWDKCSDVPSVQFVEITDAGQLIVREENASQPVYEYSHCVDAVAYKQIIDGRRDARDVVRHAYFTKVSSVRGPLSDIGGSLPESATQFENDQDVTFFYAVEGPSVWIDIQLDWLSPQGAFRRTLETLKPVGPTYGWTWSANRIKLPADRMGVWTVQMFIENHLAGEYEFRVLEPKT
jgi:hypothetical protein